MLGTAGLADIVRRLRETEATMQHGGQDPRPNDATVAWVPLGREGAHGTTAISRQAIPPPTIEGILANATPQADPLAVTGHSRLRGCPKRRQRSQPDLLREHAARERRDGAQSAADGDPVLDQFLDSPARAPSATTCCPPLSSVSGVQMRRFVVLVSTLAVLATGVGTAPVPSFAEPATVSVTSMTPGIAATGANLDITGAGFSSTPAENMVTINGRAADVSSASPDRLSVSVPAGATSGPVMVSTPSGGGTSPVDLYVPPPPFVPADVEFTARTGSDPVIATLPSANKVALLTFAANKDDRVAIQLSSGTFGASTSTARISVLRPNGSALVGATGFGNSGLWLDTRTLPETGTYTMLIDPQGTATGQVTVRTFLVPPDAQTTAEPGGPEVVATTTVPGQNAIVSITGSANQRLSVALSGSTFGPSTSNASVSVLKPDGSTLVSARGFGTSGTFLDTFKLPAAGTYRVLVDPQAAATGQVTVKVYDVGADPNIDTATDGSTVTPVTTTPGQNAMVRFSGTANQLVSAQLTGSTFGSSSSSASVAILKPDGTTLVAARGFGTAGTFIDAVKLPVAGTYSLLVDPAGSAVGQVSVRVFDAAAIEGSLAPGGDVVTTTTSVPGQNATLGFAGTAGDRVSLQLTNSTYGSSSGSAQVSVRRPDGTVLVSPRGFGSAGTFVDTFTLPATGTYSVVIDPQGTATGAVTSRLYTVPVDATVAAATDGVAHELATTVPGQNGTVTFPGTADQRFSFLLRNSTYGASTSSALVAVSKPDGSSLVSSRGLGAADLFIDTITLPSTGTYKILVDPAAAAVGSVKVQTFTVPDSDRGSISTTGGPRTVTTTVPGEDAYLALPATADQRVSLNLTSSSLTNATLTVLGPDGSTVVSPKTFGTSGTFVDFLPPITGDYRVVVNPSSTNTGSVTVQAFDAAENHTFAIPGGDEVTVATSNPGQNATVNFTGSPGQRVSIHLTDGSYGTSTTNARVSLLRPDGTTLIGATGFANVGTFLDTKTLPTTGTYTLLIDPQGTTTGQVTVKVHDVPTDPVTTLTPGGDPATVATTVPGQNAMVRFEGTADQRISVHLTDGTFGASYNSVRVSLLRPDGTTLIGATGFSNPGTFLDTKTLPTTGTYTLLIDPQGTTTGQVTVKVHDVPTDPDYVIDAGGEFVEVATTVPGQNANLAATLTAGTTYRLRVDKSTGSAMVRVTGPAGEIVDSGERASAPDDVVTFTPTTSGLHKIAFDPEGSARGTWRLELYTRVGSPRISGAGNGVDWLTNSQATVSWTTDVSGTIAGYAVSVDKNPTTNPGTTVTQTNTGYTAPLPDGENWIHVRTILTSGEAGRTAHYRLPVDTLAPTVTSLASTTHPNPDEAGPADAAITWDATDATSGVAGYSYTVSRDRATEPDNTVDTTSTAWSDTLNSDGDWVLTIKAHDHAGHWSSSKSLTFTVDAEGPGLPVLNSATHPMEAEAYPTRTFIGRWTAADPADRIQVWAVSITQTADDTPAALTWEKTRRADLESGVWYLHVRGQDAQGRWSETVHRRIEVREAAAALIAPVNEQLLWGTERVTFACAPDNTFSVAVTRGESTVDLGPVTVADDGTCWVDWATDAQSGQSRRYAPGDYSIDVRDSTGQALASTRVLVGDSPKLSEALNNHRVVGLLTAEDVAAYSYAAAFSPGSLPERYRQLVQDRPSSGEEFLELIVAGWTELSPPQQSLFDELAEPTIIPDSRSGDGSARAGSAAKLTAAASGSDCDADDVTINLPRLPEIRWDCTHRTDHFRLIYNEPDVGGAGAGGAPPAMITDHARALETAYDSYADLGFRLPDGTVPVYYAPAMGTSGLTPGEFVIMAPTTDRWASSCPSTSSSTSSSGSTSTTPTTPWSMTRTTCGGGTRRPRTGQPCTPSEPSLAATGVAISPRNSTSSWPAPTANSTTPPNSFPVASSTHLAVSAQSTARSRSRCSWSRNSVLVPWSRFTTPSVMVFSLRHPRW